MLGSLRPRRWDVLSAAVVVFLVLPEELARRNGVAGVVFDLALAVPLLWRSRWPFPVFTVTAGIAFVQWLLGVRVLGDMALLVAMYTVASREEPRTVLAAAAVLELGVVLALASWFHGAHVRSFVGLTGLAVAAAVFGRNVRNRRRLLASLQERAARLERERDQQGRLAAAAERARIARELHDVVAHNLTVMIALADGAGYALRDDPDQARTALDTASRTGRLALAEMRRLLGVLRDDGDAAAGEDRDPQPGVPEIDGLVEQVRAAGLPVSYHVSPAARDLSEGIQLTLFRIVQEALTNTLKHAGPSAAAQVELVATDCDVRVSVCDTGTAISAPANGNGAGGSGLRGMRERAAVYGGMVEAGPRPDGGWRVVVQVPLTSFGPAEELA